MYYELYIDVFFLMNFMMDYVLLAMTGKMMGCSVRKGRICLGAAVGAALTCVVMVLPVHVTFVKFILFHGVVNIVMIKTGLKIRWDRSFFRAYILLYISGILVGGVMNCFRQYLRTVSLFFAFALLSYLAASGMWEIIRHLAERKNYRCEIILWKGKRKCKILALIDTGNTLRDPLTGEPVSILARETAKKILDGEETGNIRYIPYHSIGKEEGVMPVFRLDRMIVDKGKRTISEPLVAVSEEYMTEDEYEMILNPDLL